MPCGASSSASAAAKVERCRLLPLTADASPPLSSACSASSGWRASRTQSTPSSPTTGTLPSHAKASDARASSASSSAAASTLSQSAPDWVMSNWQSAVVSRASHASSDACAERHAELNGTSSCGSTKVVRPEREEPISTPADRLLVGRTGTTRWPSRRWSVASFSAAMSARPPRAIRSLAAPSSAASALWTATRRWRSKGKASDERRTVVPSSSRSKAFANLAASRSGGAAAAASSESLGASPVHRDVSSRAPNASATLARSASGTRLSTCSVCSVGTIVSSGCAIGGHNLRSSESASPTAV